MRRRRKWREFRLLLPLLQATRNLLKITGVPSKYER